MVLNELNNSRAAELLSTYDPCYNFTKGLSIVHNIHVFVKAIFTCFIVAS
jgi:hypothetical protein